MNTDAQAPHPGETAALWIGCLFLAILPIAHTVALRYLALIALIGFAAHLAWHRRPPWSLLVPILAPLAAWTLYAALSLAWSIDFEYSEGEFRTEALYPALAFLVFFILARTASAYRVLIGTLMLSGGAVALYAIALFFMAGAWRTSEFLGVGDVGAYSTYAALALPVFVASALERERNILPPALAWSIVALVLTAATLTQNRALWLALAAGFSVYWLLRPDKTARRRTLSLIFATLALMAAALVATNSERAARIAPDNSALAFVASDARQQIWQYALTRIAERPLQGYGFGRGILRQDFRESLGDKLMWHGHNQFINIALELGLVGLALQFWLLWALGHAFWGERANTGTRQLGALGLALLASMLVKGQFDDLLVRENSLLFWSLMGILLARR